MLILGLNGSPRKKGNTHFLLTTFLEAAATYGAETRMVNVAEKNILPCKELIVCEKKGWCPIDDDMKSEIYPLLRQADVIAAASPVFFYNVTAQLKALIDRSQTLWARKYRLKLTDPARKYRQGILLAVGATQGKHLFDGLKLTAQYFFDAVGAKYVESITYRQIEGPKDMRQHPTVQDDVDAAIQTFIAPLTRRKKVLFVCRRNACRSQMASAFAQYYGGEKLDVSFGGITPAKTINPDMEVVMAENGIDMAFRVPQTIQAAVEANHPEVIVDLGSGGEYPPVPGAERIDWDLPDPAGESKDSLRRLRDDIENRVKQFIRRIS